MAHLDSTLLLKLFFPLFFFFFGLQDRQTLQPDMKSRSFPVLENTTTGPGENQKDALWESSRGF